MENIHIRENITLLSKSILKRLQNVRKLKDETTAHSIKAKYVVSTYLKNHKKLERLLCLILYCKTFRQDICHNRKENFFFAVQTESFNSPLCILLCVTRQLINLINYTKWLTKQATQVTTQITNQLISNIRVRFQIVAEVKIPTSFWDTTLRQFYANFSKKKLLPPSSG
jgi:hypothetical protein